MSFILQIKKPTQEQLQSMYEELKRELADKPLTTALKVEIAETARQRICQMVSVDVLTSRGSYHVKS